ncbi:MAG: N-acetyl-gamma-glutamyl-phosphate reductase [Gammaproteobacteria bacterium AqS3]|nr:N-acetyl-gamma-glutamyl-phosphate reductase [Gammaproteobacteria bacterium AqS3]
MSGLKVGIVGATGYAGSELVHWLTAHPDVADVRIASRTAIGQSFAAAFPGLGVGAGLVFQDPEDPDFVRGLDAVFTATPHASSMHFVPAWLDAGLRVIDLSADFRLRDVALWERTYGEPHAAPEWVARAVYALPELCAAELPGAQLAACPGCYPTAVVLGLMPALRAGLADRSTLVADCKSGTSGMGRAPKVGGLLAECAENFSVYGATFHRHRPEIEAVLGGVAAAPVELVFTPQLLPIHRGLLATLHFAHSAGSVDALRAHYAEAYANDPFVRVETGEALPQVRWVRRTNLCRIGVVEAAPGRALVVSAIDNLGKGAAGQAVEVFNLMFGLGRGAGLGLR